MHTGHMVTSLDGAKWFFDSGSLALDFAYTGDFGYGVEEWQSLEGPEDLAVWLRDTFGDVKGEVDADAFGAALDLRAAISRVALALAGDSVPAAEDIDTINAAAQVPSPAPHLAGGTTSAPETTIAASLSTIARDAISTFGANDGRIRHCAADDCAMVFYDTSRPGNRRWCSMQRCGNRTKIRAHRARNKGETP